MTIGNKLKGLRKEIGFTQSQLAKELSISTSVIGDIEIDRRPPSKVTAQKLAKYFNTNVEYWLDENANGLYKEDRSKFASTDQVIAMLKTKNMIIKGVPINDKAWEFIQKGLLIDLEFMEMENKK